MIECVRGRIFVQACDDASLGAFVALKIGRLSFECEIIVANLLAASAAEVNGYTFGIVPDDMKDGET